MDGSHWSEKELRYHGWDTNMSSVNTKTKIVAVVGPTASGKTALAIELAKRFNGEIVSCDSMQVYKDMNIGTAKPDEIEMDGIKHHMLDFVDPCSTYTCADYVRDAKKCIAEIVSNGKIPIVCGGTGLYLESLIRGGSFEDTDVDLEYRAQLDALADEKGNEYIHDMLTQVDPESADSIHYNNRKRVIRAISIARTSDVTKSENIANQSHLMIYPEDEVKIFMIDRPRELLYERINKRVDIMVEKGLIQEVKDLVSKYDLSRTAKAAIGYKEVISYLDNEISLDDCIELIKKRTRNYAKRQLTFFKHQLNCINVSSFKEIKEHLNHE